MSLKHTIAAGWLILAGNLAAEEQPQRQWTRVQGSASQGGFVCTTPTGEVYLAGSTARQSGGNGNPGGISPFLAKYDAEGNVLWRRTWGSSKFDSGNGVAADPSGNVYVTGQTSGAFDGQSKAGDISAFITKWDASGRKQWTRIWGSRGHTVGRGICVDPDGNVLVSGFRDGNVFVTSFDRSGREVWDRTWPIAGEGSALCADRSGNVYVTGATPNAVYGQANPGGFSAYLMKIDATGSNVWTRIWGSPLYDWGNRVAMDSVTNLHVVGTTSGAFDGQSNAGDYSAFLTKFDRSGNKIWTRIFGSTQKDSGTDVSIDATRSIYVAGVSYGAFGGQTNPSGSCAFLGKFDPAGNMLWTTFCGSVAAGIADSAAGIDPAGNVYLASLTANAFDGDTNSPAGGCFLTKWRAPSVDTALDNLPRFVAVADTAAGLAETH